MSKNLVLPLPAATTSPSIARQEALKSLDPHIDNGELRNAVGLIVTELVTNAVLHGAEPIRLELSIAKCDRVTIEVFDGDASTDAVTTESAADRASSGRGLLIVKGLAKSWGVKKLDSGKSVWASVGLRTG